jgi:hypothetical protein
LGTLLLLTPIPIVTDVPGVTLIAMGAALGKLRNSSIHDVIESSAKTMRELQELRDLLEEAKLPR